MTARQMTHRAAVAACALVLAGCESWITDMVQQPSVGTWQQTSADSTIASRGMPQGSVPVTGVTVASWEVSYSQFPLTIDSLSGVRNPVAVDERSLAEGRKLFQVNCAVCHGDLGDGKGKLAEVSGIAFVPSIVLPATAARTDGYIWGMMRNGRGLMS